MIRILQVGFTQNLGGIEMIIMNIYRNIDRSKVQFDFVDDCNGIYYSEEIERMGGNIIKLPTRRQNYIEYRRIIKELMSSGKYAAVHCNCLSAANIDFVKAAIKYGKTKAIVHSHQNMKLRHLKSEVLHRFNRIWMRNKNIIRLACSRKAACWLFGKATTESGVVKIVRNAIDVSRFRLNETVGMEYRKTLGLEQKFVVGCVGRFAYQKNYEFLALVFKEIKKVKPNAVLVCVGGDGGMQQTVLSIFRNLEIMDSVKLLGIREDVGDIVQTFDAFVLPSRWEGLGIVYIEAQAAGVMTFASDVVPAEAKVSDYMHFISLKESPEVWAEKIMSASLNYKKYDMAGSVAAAGYDIPAVSREMERIYLNL